MEIFFDEKKRMNKSEIYFLKDKNMRQYNTIYNLKDV